MTRLPDLDTPAALVDTARMRRNIARMQERMDALGVAFLPHVKTSKCLIARGAAPGGDRCHRRGLQRRMASKPF